MRRTFLKMCNNLLSSFLVLLVLTNCESGLTHHEDEFNREIWLDDGFYLRWNNKDPEFLIMEMSAPVKGYVAIGFSPNGGMQGSDIIMGWVDSTTGIPHIKDLYAEGNMTPLEDDMNDVELLYAEEFSDGLTKIGFKRRWNTCHSPQDMEISENTVRLIWAVSDADPIKLDGNEDQFIFPYHGPDFRGTKSLYLRVDTNQENFPDEVEEPDPSIFFWDVTMQEASIKGDSDTSYHCKIFKSPDFSRDEEKKHQIIGYRPLVDEDNEQWVHHINLFECHVPPSLGGSEEVLEKYLDHPGEECYKKNMPPAWSQHCITFPITWAVGADGLMLPDHGGIPLWEEHNGTTYWMLEIHYDNPKQLKFLDNSGLRIFITDKARENDFGQISVHSRIGQFHMIPPRATNFKYGAFCTEECTSVAFPPEGILATHVMLHGHLATKKIILRHIRNGKELPPIAKDLHYDFNYQQIRSVDPPRRILPGDVLITECEYDTTKRRNITYGGLSTRDEMCQALISYYPKTTLSICRTQHEFHNFFDALGINEVDGDEALKLLHLPYHPSPDQMFDPGDDAYILRNGVSGEPEYTFDVLHVKDPVEKDGPPPTVSQFLNKLDWTAKNGSLINTVGEKWKEGKQLALCTGHSFLRIPLKKYLVNYPQFLPYTPPESLQCKEIRERTPILRTISGASTNFNYALTWSSIITFWCWLIVLK